MGNIFDALKRHEQEQARRAEHERQANGPSDGPQPQTTGIQQAPTAVEDSMTQPDSSRYSSLLTMCHESNGRIAEQYRLLRTNLLARHSSRHICTVFTSAESGAGKTVTCLNLAFAIAEQGDRRVIVVDGDLRRGGVASLLRMKPSPGVADLLEDKATLQEVIRPTTRPNLSVVCAGRSQPDGVGQLLSHGSPESILVELQKDYDCILVDSPPVVLASDAVLWGQAVGEVIVVVKLNQTYCNAVDEAFRTLRSANIEPAGMILTNQKNRAGNYGYGYYA